MRNSLIVEQNNDPTVKNTLAQLGHQNKCTAFAQINCFFKEVISNSPLSAILVMVSNFCKNTNNETHQAASK